MHKAFTGFKLTDEERAALHQLHAAGPDGIGAAMTEAQHSVLTKCIDLIRQASEEAKRPGSEFRRGRLDMFEEMQVRCAKALIMTSAQNMVVNCLPIAGDDTTEQRAVVLSVLTEVAAIVMYACFPPADPATEKERIVSLAKEIQNDLRMVRQNRGLQKIIRPLWADEDDEE